MSVTDKPSVYIYIGPGGVHRAMFASPNVGLDEVTEENGGANALLVYHRGAPNEAPFLIETLDLGLEDEELEFTPDRPGEFFFKWAYVVDGVVVLSSDMSLVAPFVYGRLSVMRSMLSTQGCSISGVETTEVLRYLFQASKEFESLTDWHFYPKYMNLRLAGQDSADLDVPYPIVEVYRVRLLRQPQVTRQQPDVLDPSSYVVFNRHIAVRNAYDPTVSSSRVDGYLDSPGDGSGGLVGGAEDDRRNPRISFVVANKYLRGNQHLRAGDLWTSASRDAFGGRGFTQGRQAIEVMGLFGYTEADLSMPFGATFVTERLALKQSIFELGSPDDVDRVLNAHRVTMERTDTHAVQFKEMDWMAGPVTGDLTLDRHILSLSRNTGGGWV